MALDRGEAGGGLTPGTEPDEPHDARVGEAAHDRELPEILIQRDENAVFTIRAFEDRDIARVGRQVSDPLHVVTVRRQFLRRRTPNAGVEQEPHAASPGIVGSTLSCATSRWA